MFNFSMQVSIFHMTHLYTVHSTGTGRHEHVYVTADESVSIGTRASHSMMMTKYGTCFPYGKSEINLIHS